MNLFEDYVIFICSVFFLWSVLCGCVILCVFYLYLFV